MDVGAVDRTIIEDTRNKVGRHKVKNDWWAAHGVSVVRRKLDFGDYARTDDYGNVVVDTKQDVQEVAGNVGHDHARFVRECDRAADAGHRLVILVEEHPEYNDRDQLATWVSGVCKRCHKCDPLHSKCRTKRFKPLNGPTLRKIIDKLEYRHGVRFVFCDKRDTGRVICELLGIDYEKR